VLTLSGRATTGGWHCWLVQQCLSGLGGLGCRRVEGRRQAVDIWQQRVFWGPLSAVVAYTRPTPVHRRCYQPSTHWIGVNVLDRGEHASPPVVREKRHPAITGKGQLVERAGLFVVTNSVPVRPFSHERSQVGCSASTVWCVARTDRCSQSTLLLELLLVKATGLPSSFSSGCPMTWN